MQFNFIRRLKAGITFMLLLVGAALGGNKILASTQLDADKDTLREGLGKFIYDDYKPLKDRPISIYYYKPKNLSKDAPIMILMHGNSRAAENYRREMMPYAEKYNFLLIVPKFSKEDYPSRDYHQGGVFDEAGKMKKKEDWTFSVIEPLFDYIKQITNKENEGYILYGFSAGSQFVHRYSWFFPDNRAIKIITASAGSYTMPDYEIDYIYGLRKTNIPKKNLRKTFRKDYTVVVGQADTVMSREDLPKNDRVVKQGEDRVERAMCFYLSAKGLANDEFDSFHWKFVMPEGVGHSQLEMAEPVARMLFEEVNH